MLALITALFGIGAAFATAALISAGAAAAPLGALPGFGAFSKGAKRADYGAVQARAA